MSEKHILGGRYLLKDRIGAGGMASVYRAQDQVLDRTVAVKIMLPQYASDATFAARFKQEARAAAGLSSPYIVGVYDWGKDGDTYFIVMEYLHGTDLKSGIRSHGSLDPQKVAQIGAQICGALSVAHRHEIIHRDIKPQNIMVLPDGNIKVMDFGIARAKNSHLTQDNNVLGTAHYVSPEQTRGQELNATSDIYSLGVVMYECATGQVPFDGDDAISVALKQVNELPVPPSQINPRVDPTLERIILRCMEKDSAMRFQSAEELKSALNSYLAGRVVDVPAPTRVIPQGNETTRVVPPADATMVRRMPATPAGTRPAGAHPTSLDLEGAEEEDRKRSRGKTAAIVIGVIALITVAAFAFMTFFNRGGSDVPNLIGMTEDSAMAQIERSGFTASVEEKYSTDEDKGKVIEQSPDAGAKAPKGSRITIRISKGKEPAKVRKVPELVGMSASEAEAALKALNLKPRMTEEVNDGVKAGEVFWQSKEAGSEVDEGTEIECRVAKESESVNVPGVLGMSFSEASNTLSDAGFQVENGGSDYSSSYAAGQVMSQSVTGTAKKGTAVSLVVSKGPEPAKDVDVDSLDLIGMSQDHAQRVLAGVGLRYTIGRSEASATVPRGSVVRYSPTGSQHPGSTITLYISSGSEEEH
ncbi:Stk1 family PASTA domain-containing Ser/Thr kinase [Collinsella sp. AGMB00827]|uniref:non-specific serine/threonine protein kinase n=1 Tax=Collinsella ureilytica TaxID=2869515 RepID=A0ABS7MJW8_9ACTN|nr:Stk1 family PASTA domain-containing Ser/Thr kinase [Collinsella urealyticum]MBY4797608.1 Stk1 family PASTA domain-containing Ser/Thr kinase [Collinsella urealyticum]